jgi:hypothetical protein
LHITLIDSDNRTIKLLQTSHLPTCSQITGVSKSPFSHSSPFTLFLNELALAYADGGSDGDDDGVASAASLFASPHAAHSSLHSQPHQHVHSLEVYPVY